MQGTVEIRIGGNIRVQVWAKDGTLNETIWLPSGFDVLAYVQYCVAKDQRVRIAIDEAA